MFRRIDSVGLMQKKFLIGKLSAGIHGEEETLEYFESENLETD